MVKLSIIVPIYNVEKTLNRCVDSLLTQTLKDMEIILVDDGSTDNSPHIAKEYEKKFPTKVTYYRKENGGLSSARNYGMNYAKGDYVGFLDSDDYVDADLFEKMINQTRPQIKIVECNFIRENEKKKKKKFDIVSMYHSKEDYMLTGRVVAWNKIYQFAWLKETRVKFPEGLISEDLNFFFKLIVHLKNIDEVSIVHDSYVHYLKHEGTITSTYSDKILQILDSYQGVFDYYYSNGFYENYRKELEYKFCRNIFCFYLMQAIRIKDFKIRKKVLNEFWKKVSEEFPDWKRNIYLKNRSLVNIYLHVINKPIYKIFYYI